MTPKILSVNVSLPKEIDFERQRVITGIMRIIDDRKAIARSSTEQPA